MRVYKITNIVNKKCYIGIATNVNRRWNAHKQAAKNNKGNALHSAMRKYGIENFIFEEIAYSNKWYFIQEIEKFMIIRYNSLAPNGYNLTKGGEGGQHLPETIEKIRQKKAGKSYGKGRKHTDEARRNMSLAHKGKVNAGQSERMKELWAEKKKNGWKRDPQVNKNISAAIKLCWENPEYREKHAAKASEAAKKGWAKIKNKKAP